MLALIPMHCLELILYLYLVRSFGGGRLEAQSASGALCSIISPSEGLGILIVSVNVTGYGI